jgi:hypothetical protein
MKSQLLVETLTHQQANIIEESYNEGKNLFISGVFMQAETRNRNGRIYPLQEMQNAVNSMNNIIKENGSIPGELDHRTELAVASDRISHVITELRMDGNNVYGKAKILPTPCGNIAKILIQESGIRMGVSSRGAGEVNENGIVSNFNLVTIDIVNNPSCPSAYPESLYESICNLNGGHKILTLAESIQHDASAQKHLVKELKKFIESIRS